MTGRLLALAIAGAALIAAPLAAQQQRSAAPRPAPGQSSTPAQGDDQAVTNSITGGTSAGVIRDNGSLEQRQTTLLQDQRSGTRAAPFGSELFSQAPPADSTALLDPSYIMQPGDTVQINQSGMVNSSNQATVDPSGNVIVPGVGPVKIAGTPAGQINGKISAAAQSVYRSGVQTYAAPVSASKISVFVTGPVVNPGVFTGSGSDSIIGFLQRAGGPDPARGSYRHVFLRRGGRVVATLDLYAFLTDGTLPATRLQQGDVIVVGSQGPTITVSGQARAPFTFELFGPSGAGDEVLRYARPRPEVTDVSLLSIRDAKPVNEVLTLPTFAALALHDGDRVRFEANAQADTYIVQVEGALQNQASFVVPRGTRLGTILGQLAFDPLADRSMIHLKRTTVAETQKRLLNESLDRLEKVIYTSTSPTADVAAARQVDTASLQQFVARARLVQPEGLVSLQGIDPAQVILEPDDVIVVPFLSQAVVVGGEVNLPQSLLATGARDARYYVDRAGGYTDRANRGQTLVIRPDGAAHQGGAVQPGDRVLVPPKLASGTFALIKDITTILFQIGVGAAAIFR